MFHDVLLNECFHSIFTYENEIKQSLSLIFIITAIILYKKQVFKSHLHHITTWVYFLHLNEYNDKFIQCSSGSNAPFNIHKSGFSMKGDLNTYIKK